MYKTTADRRLGHLLFMLCFVIYTAAYVGRCNFSAALADMTSSGVLNKEQGGTIATLYYICYAVGQLFSGWLGSRISPFLQLTIGVAGAALCNFGMAMTGDVTAMTLIWGANGLFQSMLWAPILVIISKILPRTMCDRACAGIATSFPIGVLIAYSMSALILRFKDYRSIFLCASILLVVVFAIYMISLRHILPRLEHEEEVALQKGKGSIKQLFPLLVSAGVFFFVFPVALHGALKDGVSTWVPTMMSEMYALSPAYSAFMTMALPIVNLAGAWIAIRLRARTKSELIAVMLLFLVTGVFVLPLIAGETLPSIVSVLLLSVITTLMYAVNYFFITLIPIKFASLGGVSLVTGLLDCFAYVGSALSGYCYGVVSEYMGWNCIVYIWIGIALVGALLCFASVVRWENFKRDHQLS